MKYILTLFMIFLSYSNQLITAYQITPGLKYSLIKLSKQALPGNSLTHNYLQKITKKDHYDQNDLTEYLKKLFDFISYPNRSTNEFSQLILKCIELERELSSTHHVFYHGTRATTLILLNTVLKQVQQKERFEDFFLLRNRGAIAHLSEYQSGYDYAISKIKAVYTDRNMLGRFDNNQPMRSDLLAVNDNLLAAADTSSNEDSISFMTGNTRFGPSHLCYSIKKCLQDYELTDLPRNINCFLQNDIGSLLTIAVPKKLAFLAYLSYPFGVPQGLPISKLLEGQLSLPDMYKVTGDHQPRSLEDGCAPTDLHKYPQARLLLHPHYFEDHLSPIKMQMFLWETPEVMKEIQDKFTVIKEIAILEKI